MSEQVEVYETYEELAQRATRDEAFRAGLLVGAAVCRAHDGADYPPGTPLCPPSMLAVYIERLAAGETP